MIAPFNSYQLLYRKLVHLKYPDERFLLFDEVGERRLSLCLPKQTSSLEGVLRRPAGLLVMVCRRLRGESFPEARLLTFSDEPTLKAEHGERTEKKGLP